MASFGGYDMPLWYTSVKEEHLAVLTSAGLFDTSHMAGIAVQGPEARSLLQLCFSRDLRACLGGGGEPLKPGRSAYGVFLNEHGHVLDDAIVSQIDDEDYLVVVNSGMGPGLTEHLQGLRQGRSCQVTDLSDTVAKFDLQGPAAARILASVLKSPQEALTSLPYFSFKGHFDPRHARASQVRLRDGSQILLSRSGYTGEFGFEIFVQPFTVVKLWEMILEAGQDFGLTPCGLAARDSLRVGAVLPLSHQDIGDWPFINNPWTIALPFNAQHTGFTKEFIGGQALLNLDNPEHTVPFVGQNLRKVTVSEKSAVLDQDKESLGAILTCATDMGIDWHEGRIVSIASQDRPDGFSPRGLSCGFVRVTRQLHPGDRISLTDGKRTIPVTVVRDIRPDRTARRPLSAML
jgi:aminomethyltransferase